MNIFILDEDLQKCVEYHAENSSFAAWTKLPIPNWFEAGMQKLERNRK